MHWSFLVHQKLAEKSARSRCRTRKGTAVVEFALTFPVALVLFFSQVYFVQFFITSNSTETAAYLGARRGILPGTTNAEIETLVRRELALSLVNDCNVTILRDGVTSTVRIDVSLADNAWITTGFNPIPAVITRSCTLKAQID